VVHASDLHLGTTSYGVEDPATGVNGRVHDFFKAFDQVVDYAIDKKADVLILCGDTFKDVSPSSTLLKMFATRLHKLSSENVQIIMLLGNHDSPKTAGRAAPPEVFEELKLKGVHVFAKPDFIDLKSKDGVRFRVFALPYRHPIHVAAKVEKAGGLKVELDRDALLTAFQTEIKRNLEIFRKAGKKGADIGILAAHLFVEGARRGAERIYIVGEEFAVPPGMLQSDALDYVALGHVHSHQTVPGKVPIVYPGSLERIDFSEADEQKGFVDITYLNKRLTWKFIPVKTRRMIRLELDCTQVKDPKKFVADKLEKVDLKDAIVRVSIKVGPETHLDLDTIHEKLAASSWQQVNLERVVEEQPVSVATTWASLNPHETLARYLKTIKLPNAEKELVTKLGGEIVDEVLLEAEKQ
jgi:exonuclease SbcD